MALKWIIGDFRNGAISESNDLPVVYNEGDKVEIDINANESATITVSKNDLPSDWRTYLRPIDRFVALVETDLAWASSVIWAGFINKASARVNETIQIQATGLREYMAARIVSNLYNTTNTDPTANITFSSSSVRGLMANMILSCFSSSGISSSNPKPPQVLSSVTGSASGSTVKHSVLLSDFESYGNLLDEWRDELSDAGQEYRFKPSWSSSSKTAIRWIGEVASTSTPHFNEANTLNIVLGDNSWKPLSYGQSASSDNMVSRIIGQSKEGEKTTGADYQTRTITLANSILLDESWNPGVELTDDQMFQNLNARLVYNSQSFKEADFSRAYETTAELRTIISQLGSMATFSGSGASQYFGLTMRIVGVSFNPSKKTVELQLAPKAARYPKLPKDNRGLKKKSQTRNTGRPKTGINGLPGHYGDYNVPIIKQPKPGYNGTVPVPGGIVSPGDLEDAVNEIANPIPDKPFQPPIYNNPRDAYTDESPIIEVVDMRSFKSVSQKGDMTWGSLNISQFGHDFPDLTRSRFNYSTGKLIGINKSAIGGDLYSNKQPPELGYYDIDVFEIDAVGMFNRDENPYMNDSYSFAPPNPADDFKLKVGSISYGMYSDLYIDPSTLKATIPPAESTASGDLGIKYSTTSRAWDFNFFCSADHQTVFVQIMYTIGKWQIDKNSVIDGMKKSYSMTRSKVFKGVRNSEGKVEEWEDLGDALSDDSNEYPWVFFSPNIYDINGEFKAFGGYYIPEQEEGILIFDGLLPDYSLKFYGQGITNVNVENFSFNQTAFDLPDTNRKVQTEPGKEFLNDVFLPLAVNVDYSTQKVILGISKGQRNRSTFFEADFSNLTSYKKIMDTEREDIYPYLGYDTGTDNNNDGEPDVYPPVDPFSLTSRAPIKYKNNYIQFNPEGINITRQPSTAINYNNKKIKWLRTKSSFSDVVKGELGFNRYAYDTSSEARTFKYAYPIHNTAVSNGNLLNAFRGYIGRYAHITAHYNDYSYNDLPKPYNGFEYFYLNGFLYVFCDAVLNKQDDLTNWDNGREGRTNLHSRYWIGKFKLNDDILGN